MSNDKIIIGWRERVHLNAFNLINIKAKMDTGAKTSTLYGTDVEEIPLSGQQNTQLRIKFKTFNGEYFETDLLEWRDVRSSNGHCDRRPVIKTKITFGDQTFDVKFTLSDRQLMKFPILLGRNALYGHYIVDPEMSYVLCSGTLKE